MISIYDDVSYVESMNNNIMNDDEERNIQIAIQGQDQELKENISNKISCKNDTDEFEYIIVRVCQKHMFEKLLRETLDELNKTNPSLESGKYHMLCIYARRYDCFIKRIDNLIIIYELNQLKKQKKHPYSEWYWNWNWKTMTFNSIKHIHDYYNSEKQNTDIEKNINDKKRD